MLSALELREIQTHVRGAFGVYLRLEHGARFYQVDCVPDGISWLLKVTSEMGVLLEGAIDGETVEQQLLVGVDALKKDLFERGAPS